MRKLYILPIGLVLVLSIGCKKSARNPATAEPPATPAAQANQPDKPAPRKGPPDPATRRKRNIETLEAEGLAPPKFEPDLDESRAQIRSPKEAARKCLAWFVVAYKARQFEDASKLPRFRLTESSMTALRENKLPEPALAKIAGLKGKPFENADLLTSELKKLLTTEEFDQVQQSVLDAALLGALELFVDARRKAKQNVLKFIADNDLMDVLNMYERAYIFKPCPVADVRALQEDERQNRKFVKYYERVWVMLWALRCEKDLGSPRYISDIKEIHRKIMRIGTGEFVTKAKLRVPAWLLDKYDLMQRNYLAAYVPGIPVPDDQIEDYQSNCNQWFVTLAWLVGRDDPDDYVDAKLTPDQRKARSEEILRGKKIPVNAALPVWDDESAIKVRSAREVARRALVVRFLAERADALAARLPADPVMKVIEDRKLKDELTPEEKAFLENPAPAPADIVKFQARHECAWLMLWALGYVEPLGDPVQEQEQVEMRRNRYLRAGLIIKELGDDFEKMARLRTPAELLDKADLMYRYNWVTIDAQNRGPFVIDDTLLESLRGVEEISEVFLGKLNGLKDKPPFKTGNEFSAELKKILDKEELAKYHDPLLNLARKEKLVIPGNLDWDILRQWHYTLHWLTGRKGQAWDKVEPAG